VPLISERMETILILNFYLIVVGEWIGRPIAWLDNAIWRVAEVIEAILHVIFFEKALLFDFFQIILEYILNGIPIDSGHAELATAESGGMRSLKLVRVHIVLMQFRSESFLRQHFLPQLSVVVEAKATVRSES
jgi:hypothetical protein